MQDEVLKRREYNYTSNIYGNEVGIYVCLKRSDKRRKLFECTNDDDKS